jgi:hypothetical protein
MAKSRVWGAARATDGDRTIVGTMKMLEFAALPRAQGALLDPTPALPAPHRAPRALLDPTPSLKAHLPARYAARDPTTPRLGPSTPRYAWRVVLEPTPALQEQRHVFLVQTATVQEFRKIAFQYHARKWKVCLSM